MNTWNWLLHFLIIFDLVAFGIYFGGDILFTAISKVQKKSKKNDDLDLMILKLRPHPKNALYVWTQSECFILVR